MGSHKSNDIQGIETCVWRKIVPWRDQDAYHFLQRKSSSTENHFVEMCQKNWERKTVWLPFYRSLSDIFGGSSETPTQKVSPSQTEDQTTPHWFHLDFVRLRAQSFTTCARCCRDCRRTLGPDYRGNPSNVWTLDELNLRLLTSNLLTIVAAG